MINKITQNLSHLNRLDDPLNNTDLVYILVYSILMYIITINIISKYMLRTFAAVLIITLTLEYGKKKIQFFAFSFFIF